MIGSTLWFEKELSTFLFIDDNFQSSHKSTIRQYANQKVYSI